MTIPQIAPSDISSSAECIYLKSWLPSNRPASSGGTVPPPSLSASSDDAKLVFGTVFSLRNMARKLGGDDDAFISYRTGQYKLHFYETPANLRFVMITDTASVSMRNVLHQIYINLWVEYGMPFSLLLCLILQLELISC